MAEIYPEQKLMDFTSSSDSVSIGENNDVTSPYTTQHQVCVIIGDATTQQDSNGNSILNPDDILSRHNAGSNDIEGS